MDEKKVKAPKQERIISFGEALGLLLVVVVVILLNARVFGIGTGLSVLSVAMICAAYGMFVLHIQWDDMMKEILGIFSNGMGAVMILLMVGFIGSSWTVGGTTPMLIYYGLKMVTPGLYLIVAFVLCMIMGMATGSAWAIMGSVGLALAGVAQGLGIPMPLAAAAIAGGSYVGDKWTPFSDVTNLSAACTRGNSFDVFKAMIPVEVPAFIGSVILYGILGMRYAGSTYDPAVVDEILVALDQVYNFNILLLIPPIFVIVMCVLKYPIIPVLTASSLMAVVFGVIFQGEAPAAAFNVLYSGVTANTGNEAIDKLLSGGGLTNMMSLILTIFCAFIFAGILERMGLLKVLLKNLSALSKKSGNVILISMITGIAGVYLTASVYVSDIINCRIWKDVYEDAGMDSLMLARTMNSGMSNWGMIVPWSGGVAVMVSTFGVTWSQYAPYLFNTWLAMALVLIFGYTGKFIMKKEA